MPGRQLQTEAFVLTRKPPSDRFQQLAVFSALHGDLLCLRRLPTKSAPASAILDLFDETELWLETSNEGRTWFIKEARVVATPQCDRPQLRRPAHGLGVRGRDRAQPRA